MKTSRFILLALFFAPLTALAGPPFQTDDPEPIGYKNYEFYTFGTVSHFPGETDTQAPAFEFNWGALPNTHLHIIAPLASYIPENGTKAVGVGDIELGIKYRFVQETKSMPQIGTFTMFEIPSGNSKKGLGVGKTWYKLPLWAQKSFGPWTTYGGGGEVVIPAKGYRNYPFAGGLVQRELNKKIALATEVFYHGQVTNDTRYSTMLDLGGYYKFRGNDSFQMLFCYGHSIAGQAEKYGYLGLYWTWGGKKGNGDKPGEADKPAPSTAFNRLGPPGVMGHI
ncbi:MAG: transporter [Acidobacteriota bacterium]|nr:transporter [Acidobacteriota bacterium]